ncbi:MAG: EVE domain-containing protein [Ignavibacteriales bacterium]|nr:EVE domain-containing protein [Ignavibacteriales bacterium]
MNFLESGGNTSGFRESRWSTVQKNQKGDFLICYLTGVSRFIGILEVISEPFQDNSLIWKDEDFPARLKVKPIITLKPNTAYSCSYIKG